MDIQACSLNLVMSLRFLRPCDFAKGARMYSMAGQEDDAKEYEVTIVPADAVIPGVRIIVREVKVLGGVVPGARHAVGEEEEGEEVEGEA
jgi:hypothetical protein